MADFELIEADFQQFYNLDISTLGFRRYARLLINLPVESRFIRKYSLFKDWDWNKEVQSQILRMLDFISCQIINIHRKKGTSPAKVNEQFQPDYVKKAKKKLQETKKIESLAKQNELAEIFEKRNNRLKKIEGKINAT